MKGCTARDTADHSDLENILATVRPLQLVRGQLQLANDLVAMTTDIVGIERPSLKDAGSSLMQYQDVSTASTLFDTRSHVIGRAFDRLFWRKLVQASFCFLASYWHRKREQVFKGQMRFLPR